VQDSHEHFMREALKVAAEGLGKGELPIGAVVVLDDQILASAHSMEKSQGRLLVHADLLALEAADKIKPFPGNRRDVRMYVTGEPCLMCLGPPYRPVQAIRGAARVWSDLGVGKDHSRAMNGVLRCEDGAPISSTQPVVPYDSFGCQPPGMPPVASGSWTHGRSTSAGDAGSPHALTGRTIRSGRGATQTARSGRSKRSRNPHAIVFRLNSRES
jgi:hypothetical protein